MQHVFIDVEAFGPPGIGRPFALGAVKFNMSMGVYARFQCGISWPGMVHADQETLNWLLRQEPRVLAQARDGVLFRQAWAMFYDFVYPDQRDPTTFWADDFSDFAWLDYEARAHQPALPPLRSFGSQCDSSALIKLADPLKVYSVEKYGELVPHIAMDDATAGALDLIASLNILGRALP